MKPRSVTARPLVRALALLVLGVLLASCSAPGAFMYSKPEKEPAPLREPLWSARLSAPKWVIVARATDDAVVVVADHDLIVLDRRSGRRRWSRTIEISVYQANQLVFVVGDGIVVLDDDAAAVFDVADGDLRFRWRADDSYGSAGFGVVRSGLLVNTCRDLDRRCVVSLLDFRTGKSRWQRQFPLSSRLLPPEPRDVTPGSGGPGASDLSDPLQPADGAEAIVLTDGSVQSPEEPDRAVRLDTQTGGIVGSFVKPRDLGRIASPGGGTRLVGNVILYSESACGFFAAYDARTGAQRWTRALDQRHLELPAVSYVDDVSVKCDRSSGPPVVDGGLLVSTTTARPQILDLGTGEPRWTSGQEGVWLGFDKNVAVTWTDPDGPYRALDTKAGGERWTHRPPWLQGRDPRKAKRMLAAYAVAYGQFFYSGIEDDGNYRLRSVVRVLDLRSGRPVWAARGDNRLVGVGTDWVVTTSVPRYGDPVEIRLFKR